jgi:diadenosine tetraphosphatase ApaH/serine/threonine PP2A family protein phosphatase
LNTFLYLVCLKLEFPQSVFMLRGNHESRQVSTRYGFYHEIILNYGHAGLWMMCNDVFDLLPLAALIDQDVFCVHGGLSPKIPMLEKISLLDRIATVGAARRSLLVRPRKRLGMAREYERRRIPLWTD